MFSVVLGDPAIAADFADMPGSTIRAGTAAMAPPPAAPTAAPDPATVAAPGTAVPTTLPGTPPPEAL